MRFCKGELKLFFSLFLSPIAANTTEQFWPAILNSTDTWHPWSYQGHSLCVLPHHGLTRLQDSQKDLIPGALPNAGVCREKLSFQSCRGNASKEVLACGKKKNLTSKLSALCLVPSDRAAGCSQLSCWSCLSPESRCRRQQRWGHTRPRSPSSSPVLSQLPKSDRCCFDRSPAVPWEYAERMSDRLGLRKVWNLLLQNHARKMRTLKRGGRCPSAETILHTKEN